MAHTYLDHYRLLLYSELLSVSKSSVKSITVVELQINIIVANSTICIINKLVI